MISIHHRLAVHKVHNHNNDMESPTYEHSDYVPDSSIIYDDDFKTCHVCSRKFNPDTYKKHVRICEKTTSKKRKPFDSYRQRREGTDLADFLPKNFGFPAQKQSPTEVKPQPIPPKPVVLSPSPRRASEPAIKTAPSTIKAEPILRTAKRIQAPVSEECPICKRSFGVKAYDRHVEWCKEKARIAPHKSVTPNAAKERLEARTKYKAPIVKSKREINREKYSGLSCSESTNSLSDAGSGDCRSHSQSEERERKISISASMTSSINSDGDFDKYDPFISAKRQLDELFPPVNIATSTPKTKTAIQQMSKSLNIKSPSNPTCPSSFSNKSNFRRTSSLRVSKKCAKPLYSPVYVKSSTIQRGISDEGPISSNFMKPEEYDELPVKSHAIITPELVPKSPRESPRQSPQQSSVIKRDQSVSANRRNLRLDLKEPNKPSSDFSLSKTDSLAAFLKYEHDLNCTPSLTEKERKDKSNSLNKQTYSKNILSNILNNQKNDKGIEPSQLSNHFFTPRKYNSIKLAPLDKTFHGNFSMTSILSPPHTEYDSNFIDPKLINICDNLSIDHLEEKQAESVIKSRNKDGVTSSDLNSSEFDSNKVHNQRSSEEKRFFNRQLKLNKENFLYESNSGKESLRDVLPKFGGQNTDIDDAKSALDDPIDSLFNDFDFDEFITSFDDDEQYPIFKDYKEKLLNREKIKCEISNSNSSDTSLEEQIRKEESKNIHSSNVPVTKSIPPPPPLINQNQLNKIKVSSASQPKNHRAGEYDNGTSHSNKNLQKSIDELDQLLSVTDIRKMYPFDSEELSSGENSYTNHTRSPAPKSSADSAYGSLSRQSQTDRAQRRNTTRQQRHQIPDIICNKMNTKASIRTDQPKKTDSPNSLSSSGSESSLPPITSQKIEIHSQNINSKELQRFSKFCHACGNKFTFTEAKFCMECGTRRIIID